MAVNNNDLIITKACENILFGQTQSMSHYYKVIVHRAFCMDSEYAI